MQDKSKLPILIFPEGKLLCGEAGQLGESRAVLEEPVFTTSAGGPLGWSWNWKLRGLSVDCECCRVAPALDSPGPRGVVP